jgi:ketosteroid isomerase-like protein
MRSWAVLLVVGVVAAACARTSELPSPAEQRAIADSLARQVKAAYDLSQPDVEQRLLSLYPPSGRVVSATAGQVTTSRDSLAMGIKAFWENVGVNMREPKWIWDEMLFDVPAANTAIMTARYHVSHLTPRNEPHTIGGAWTAVFQKRGDRWYVIQEHLSDLPTMSDTTGSSMPAGHMMPGR